MLQLHTNYIQITGDKTEIKEFSEMLKPDTSQGQTDIDIYENLFTEFERQREDARWFSIDVHEYEFIDIGKKDEKEEIIISGDSAWCPCLGLFTKISERFKSFHIRYEYEEAGCDFAGYANITDGNCDDNMFSYWKGIIATQGETDALDQVLSNEMECYETEEELIESDMYLAFSDEIKKEILESYKNSNN